VTNAKATIIAAVIPALVQAFGYFINSQENKPTTILNNFNSGFQGVLNILPGSMGNNSKITMPLVKFSGGLEAVISSAGRSKDLKNVSVAMTLINRGRNTLFLTLAGPTSAQDNNGGFYRLHSASGISLCPTNYNVKSCITTPDVLLGMTQIDPGNQVNLAFSLFGVQSKGPLISFSTALVGRIVSDLEKDVPLSDEEKKKQLRSFSLSSPPVKLVEAQ
jgi:hypothetical protein